MYMHKKYEGNKNVYTDCKMTDSNIKNYVKCKRMK